MSQQKLYLGSDVTREVVSRKCDVTREIVSRQCDVTGEIVSRQCDVSVGSVISI